MPYQFNPLTGNFDLVNPQLTGAEIKTLYEGEDNTNAFTDAEKSKLTGLDSANYATAEQGVKADNSVQLTGSQTVTGTKTFTSPLILPNNSRINGVEHFYQSTKPVTRGDGSTLVIGDRWWKTDTGEELSWNGTYWLLPEQKYQVYNTTTIANSTNILTLASFVFPSNLFLLKTITTNWLWLYVDPSNFWSVQLQYARRTSTPVSIGSPITSTTNQGTIRDTKVINTVFDLSVAAVPTESLVFRIGYNAVRTGTVGAIIFHGLEFKCHEIFV